MNRQRKARQIKTTLLVSKVNPVTTLVGNETFLSQHNFLWVVGFESPKMVGHGEVGGFQYYRLRSHDQVCASLQKAWISTGSALFVVFGLNKLGFISITLTTNLIEYGGIP